MKSAEGLCNKKHPRVGYACILKEGHNGKHFYVGAYNLVWEWEDKNILKKSTKRKLREKYNEDGFDEEK